LLKIRTFFINHGTDSTSSRTWNPASCNPAEKQTPADFVKTKPLLEIANKSWKMFLSSESQERDIELLRKHERTGRPLGGDSFIEKLELLLDRNLKPQKPGPKKKDQ
jgi:putative transposase